MTGGIQVSIDPDGRIKYPKDYLTMAEPQSTQAEPAPPSIPVLGHAQARAMGFTGGKCPGCGHRMLVPNGTCTKCMVCGATSGCS